MPRLVVLAAAAAVLAMGPSAVAAEPDARGVEFFEKKIRPVLVEHCYACHSRQATKLKGGLFLDSRAGMLRGGETGPAIIPGQPTKSLLIQALRQEDELRMPPKGKLSEAVIADFVRWIEAGAPDPRTAQFSATPRREFRITEEDRRHWAFQAAAGASLPKAKNEAWCRADLDRFILARLEKQGLRPSQPADPHALLRRITFDLTGLPPTPGEIADLIADCKSETSDQQSALAKVVDRLLASKEFGVRWARHWLDGVRYASNVDKGGLYRDWVVRAFNDDLPYDKFVRLQIAGDLIPAETADPARVHADGASFDGVIATGMLALATWEKVGRDLAVAEIVDSQIDVVSRQFLGLTLACARCHDHKFDPLSTEDYYALAGVFFSSHVSPGKLIADDRLSDEVIGIPLLTKKEAARNRDIDERIGALEEERALLEAKAGPAAKLRTVREELRDLPARIGKAAGAEKTKLTAQLDKLRAQEKALLDDRARKRWPDNPPELADIDRLSARIVALGKERPSPPVAIGIREGGIPGTNRERIGDAPIYVRGDHRKEGPVVPRRFPFILAGDKQTPLGQETSGSGRRELAEWLTAPDNPLTARVMVNRVWLHLFGEGLVRTPDNFGMLGERPAHPELLDHLSRRFVASGWSVKKLIREIVLSSTYQQSSFADKALLHADPENRLLGRVSRKRLSYEALRDSLLFVSGDLARRTLYEPIERGRIDPARALFDGPDPLVMAPQRRTSTTTPQALYLMNSPLVAKAAERLAERLQKDAALKDDRARIVSAYVRLLGRAPSAEETRIGEEYLERGTWSNYLQAILCSNEFIYVD